MKHLHDLSDTQRKAVLHRDGPLLLLAGAGAGKTRTLTRRIIHLIHSGVHPGRILAVTFTNKAAKEMMNRVLTYLEGTDVVPEIRTFHSLGVLIIREHSQRTGRTKQFSILDTEESKKLIKEAFEQVGFDQKELDPRRVQQRISKEKGDGRTAEEFSGQAESHFEGSVGELWHRYERLLKEHNAFDFDDLLVYTHELLKDDSIRKLYQDRYQYIHIDEYQDTNALQYNIARLLTGAERNICVVGDSDQNIYSWRGANVRNILNFETDFPGATVIYLEENYRSTKTIIEASNRVIEKNTLRKEKRVFTNNPPGEKISLHSSATELDEAQYVAERIVELKDSGVPYDDIAVLYRANFQSRVLEEACLRYSIPYQVLGTKFFQRKEVKDMIAYLRAALDRKNLADIKRTINTPRRGIGKVTIAKLFSTGADSLSGKVKHSATSYFTLLDRIKKYAAENTVAETLRYILKGSGLETTLKEGSDEDVERLENIWELISLATRYNHLPKEERVLRFLEDAALQSDQDELKEERPGVKLMTVHAAKGLEFGTVFVVGLEQDLFPHHKDGEKNLDAKEEERRLFYVALTRAKERLFLTYAQSRLIFGSRSYTMPSEFLDDIPPELYVFETGDPDRVVYFDI